MAAGLQPDPVGKLTALPRSLATMDLRGGGRNKKKKNKKTGEGEGRERRQGRRERKDDKERRKGNKSRPMVISTRSSATAEKQRVSCASLHRLAN